MVISGREDGYDGLIPKYSGGRPSKLSDEQKVQLKEILKERDDWITKEIKYLILKEFVVEYSLMQIHGILKKFGMKFAKPYPHDYRKPVNAEDTLKKDTSNR
ncbi:transposase [Methanococcoides alaskense]|uniref:Transposase n=1 Tax=Methanococcoides alaskense TaxID=325778 RepID=A0AA90U0A1_9EURY|nr:transposase [Methanococcoides alaskense]